ncbi:RHS repeat-associated core domain-containing protein [Actinacidiphila bryophytorum]|uniref:RHS repeat-associated core domain-containing protein n=1 Tax=Actinacidiphila bryophytorum TaxID=1436133 RepID=A0A9W4GX17_9ACTN|nr:RHS repeat-associated core domain-containing protein [Actinacidiphila bryophytorum]MBM9436539.1 RHS repeat-associated core domain-containing protein [Actinacidiphila bryophytorum]MBN6542278.1 RHS repeat-associated core domain-containing protein [Actinacidiphila bryophytorum]CAG7600366.1 RHS repeat-associated core domain-containing protein [Actinacidiphila bryophytorum]
MSPQSGFRLPRRSAWWRGRTIGAALAAAVVVPMLGLSVGPAAAADGPGALGRTGVQKPRSTTTHTVALGAKKQRDAFAAQKAADGERAARALGQQHAAWPKGGTAKVAAGATSAVSAGGLPVTLTGGAAGAQVTVADRAATEAAGVRGVLVAVTGQAGAPAAGIRLGYAGFASVYGGNWSGRLGLERLPACALTTPEEAACRTGTPVASSNDAATQTVSAALPQSAAAQPMVLALTAGAEGEATDGAGDFTATALSPSASWTAGDSSGSFTWSYGMDVPSAAAGPAPSVGLAYDSGSVDGLTATTNNQGTQVGSGFTDTAESYIGRDYGSCDDDGQSKVYDLCWKYDNASLVLGGKSTELVKDDTTGTWRLADDDASTVVHSTGADNGDQGDSADGSGEYWTVTTGDGTKYVFGQNKLPGATTQRTNSVWTVPVFGDDSGEPGYAKGSAFADRWYNQAWRWNLDYVVDTHGNAESFWYTAETNSYKKNKATTANATYTRGGYLDHILYGQRSDTLFTATAGYQVHFGYQERCLAADCSSLTEKTAQSWPDVPFDQICAANASDTDCKAVSPSFFSRKRLTQVQTSVWSGSGTTYTPVDTWALTQKYLDPGDIGDSSDQSLVLDSITRTGSSAGSVALKPVSFTYQMLANRVDATDNILPLSRPRIEGVTTETGAVTTVTMSTADDCVRGLKMPAAEDDDTMNCYPVYWHINGATDAGLDWFHKYRVLSVSTADPTGNNEPEVHSYDYAGPAWHYNDSPLTPQDERTWSIWRGYGTVTQYTGTGGSREKTVTTYMQGMNGDKKKSGPARSASVAGLDVPGLAVPAVTDADQYAGFTRESVTYNGATAISATLDDPWSARTATQHKSYADTEAYYVRLGKTYAYTWLTAQSKWRATSKATTYDSYGMPVSEDDAGDTAASGDETCTRTWYARNTGTGLTSLVSRTRKVARPCGTADSALSLPAGSSTAGDVLSDTGTVYDSPSATTWTSAQTPTKGDGSWTGRAAAYPATADSGGERKPTAWQTTGTQTFDALGRTLVSKDAAGNPDTTAYTPAGAGPLTRTVETNAEGQTEVTFYERLRGRRAQIYDANNKLTEATYDGLGRLTGVWLPNRSKGGGESANTTYAYHVDNATQSYVATSTLGVNNARSTSYQIYDALLRPVQQQTPTPIGGRLLTDTRYDSRGLATATYADTFDSAHAPGGTYDRGEYGGTPTQHQFTFDGAGRTTADQLLVYGVPKWTVSTSYTGDSTATSAPAGGSATRTVTDALGRTTELREYAGPSYADTDFGATAPVPAHTTTAYTYTGDDKKLTVTGPDGAKWSWGYDLFGRQTSATDPDAGTSTTAYTVLDQVDTNTDAEGRREVFGYDDLGRKTTLWQGSRSDANKVASWTYDTVAKGQPASSTRYDAGKQYTDTVTAYDNLYNVTASTTHLDAADPLVASGAAQQDYSFTAKYNTDGTLAYSGQPAVAGLPAENISYGYTATGNVRTVVGTSNYVLDTAYSATAQPEQLTLGVSPSPTVKQAYLDNEYEEGTGRLLRSFVTDDTHAWMPQDLHYTYDDAGDVTKISNPATLGGTTTSDTQCFGYDGYQRLTTAWTPAGDDCTTGTAATAALGGPAPYSSTYTYTAGGLRTGDTERTAAGATATTTYCYGKPGQPHTLTSTVTTGTCTGAADTYVYDKAGNTTARPVAGTSGQTLTWNAEGDLTGTTEGADSAGYLYDADDDLLIRHATGGDGESVLYLDGTELHSKKGADGKVTTWGVREYTDGDGGQVVAERTTEPGVSALSWIASDSHGTAGISLDGTTQAVTTRYTTPFGTSRGSSPAAWPDDKGFLGAPADPDSGLTHVGDREYDPLTGRFLSIDPQLETDKPQTLNGYGYAADNPVTFSDPTGDGLACGFGDWPACPHTPSKGKGDGGDHRTEKEKRDDARKSGKGNTTTHASSTNSGGKHVDSKTQNWLRKNLGYNGGANLDDKTFRNWLDSADGKFSSAIREFDKCLQSGSSAEQCKGAVKLPHGRTTADKLNSLSNDVMIGSAAMMLACAATTGPGVGVCGAAALTTYTVLQVAANAYQAYYNCRNGFGSSCLKSSLQTVFVFVGIGYASKFAGTPVAKAAKWVGDKVGTHKVIDAGKAVVGGVKKLKFW